MAFHVGQKVVCVDADGVNPLLHSLDKGAVYQLRHLLVDDFGVEGCFLVGVKNFCHAYTGIEHGYEIRRFRPVVTRKTDISIFTEMLTNTPSPVEA